MRVCLHRNCSRSPRAGPRRLPAQQGSASVLPSRTCRSCRNQRQGDQPAGGPAAGHAGGGARGRPHLARGALSAAARDQGPSRCKVGEHPGAKWGSGSRADPDRDRFRSRVGRHAWSMWPWMRPSRMSETSSCSTSRSSMFSWCATNAMRMRVYGWISFRTTCVRASNQIRLPRPYVDIQHH